ncbi:TIGR03862 family flavoprotein [Pseudomonadota bacterium]
MSTPSPSSVQVAIVGGGPAGLMAAEILVKAGADVHIYDAMPSLGRKFLMAGKSGLNITHAEAFEVFLTRFGDARETLEAALNAFTPDDIQAWTHDLGIETFVGTSNRIFPQDFKAAPLLRAWLRRLREAGVTTHVRHKWCGWADGSLKFETPDGEIEVKAETTVLALGGASWPDLGSTGAWVKTLESAGVAVAPLKPANCGFDVDWSAHILERFEGHPIKSITATFNDETVPGECVITKTGIEGGPIYALSAPLRDALDAGNEATVELDLKPGLSAQELTNRLSHPRGKKSMATHLKRTVNLSGAKAALLREFTDKDVYADPALLCAAIKALPVPLTRTRPLAEAISSAGGVRLDQIDQDLQLTALPGVFVTGEMLDWEAITGGYLLSGCFALGRVAGHGVAKLLEIET